MITETGWDVCISNPVMKCKAEQLSSTQDSSSNRWLTVTVRSSTQILILKSTWWENMQFCDENDHKKIVDQTARCLKHIIKMTWLSVSKWDKDKYHLFTAFLQERNEDNHMLWFCSYMVTWGHTVINNNKFE